MQLHSICLLVIVKKIEKLSPCHDGIIPTTAKQLVLLSLRHLIRWRGFRVA